MPLIDKIATLRPIIVSGAFLATVAATQLFLRATLEWPLFWIMFGLSALFTFSFMALWTWSAASLVMSRTESNARERAITTAHLRSALIYFAFCIVIMMAMPSLLPWLGWPVFAAGVITNLAGGYNWLRALWRVAKRLPGSDHTFTTFLQILYFPFGVWFLYPRLKQLQAAPPLAT